MKSGLALIYVTEWTKLLSLMSETILIVENGLYRETV